MSPSEIVFWVAAALVLYPYLVYPLLVALAARLRGRPVRRQKGLRLSVSFILCVHNERERVAPRLHELLGVLEATGIPGEILVVDDGSTDDTVAVVRALAPLSPRSGGEGSKTALRVVELPQWQGKAAALSRGAALARGEVLVLADVRQTWAPDALELLLENFADPQVGAVSGDLVVLAEPGVVAGVGMYWRVEKWLRCQESRLWAQVGVTGAISAVRRDLFAPVPPGTLLDDVYWPLGVAMKGYRVVHDSRALAYDRLPERARDEFRRKVRTLTGNFQLAARLGTALLPWRNPIWAQLLSHKLARLVVPWALPVVLAGSLLAEGWVYRAALAVQALVYALGAVGLATRRGGLLTAAPASFLVLNAAGFAAFWVWLTGRATRSWVKVSYDRRGAGPPLEVAAGLQLADSAQAQPARWDTCRHDHPG
jgi:cellulose synthase/poly-beta-1,6-N-acetylglucosamine synthase-like glycosyltransferase